MRRDGAVRVRIPEFTRAADVRARVNDTEIPNAPATAGPDYASSLPGYGASPTGANPCPARAFGNYLELGRFRAGDRIEVNYPLPVATEEIAIGNPGFRQWRYKVTWKGDTVARMEPMDNHARTAYSDFEKADTEVYYDMEGPGPLYQRQEMFREDVHPRETELVADSGALDFWKIR